MLHVALCYLLHVAQARALELKERGNTLYKNGDYPQAMAVYSQVSRCLGHAPPAVVQPKFLSGAGLGEHLGHGRRRVPDVDPGLDVVPWHMALRHVPSQGSQQ